MGLIRGGLFSLVMTLLFITLFLSVSFATVYKSLDYDVVSPQIKLIVQDMINSEETNLTGLIKDNFFAMEIFCENDSNFVQDYGGYNFDIPCTIVGQGSDAVISYIEGDLMDKIIRESYYKKYDCSFFECAFDSPLYFASEHAYNYWKEKFYWALTASLLLSVLAFFLIEKKTNFPFALGVPLVISALPFAKTEWLFSFISDVPFVEFAKIFLTKASSVFFVTFIIGLVLIGAGIVLKFVDFGEGFQGFLDKFKKKDYSKNK